MSALAPAQAQTYRFSTVEIEGNQRVDAATILSYAGIGRGQTLSAADLNTSYQGVVDSGLFEQVEMIPAGGKLIIRVVEYPTINLINFEGNKRIKDEDLQNLIQSQSRRVYSPRAAEADAAAIVQAYEQQGRLAATVDPRIIRRSDNRVDLVFEVTEGKVVEIERISFVGNRAYSDRRLRRVLGTKQAGLLRQIIRSDTFIADRIAFDRQVLTDFYASRGYIDMQVLSVAPELTRNRDAFVLTFNIREGQQFRFGEVTVTSDMADVDPAIYQDVLRLRPGVVYSPVLVEKAIERIEGLALREGLDFVRIEPRITRNDRDLTLDVELAMSRGPRIFVERIDIEGNVTTLDRVIRRQFKTVEGDPFNPRAIREASQRITALGFFETAEVSAREGTTPDRVIVDVDVEEKPTGSLSFGLSYSVATGVGTTISFSEANFLGRGQYLSFAVASGTDDNLFSFRFAEPAFLARDVRFGIGIDYSTSSGLHDALYDTRELNFSPSLQFPTGEFSRLELRYSLNRSQLFDYSGASPILQAEVNQGQQITSSLGYTWSRDTRDVGLNPNAGVLLRFSQDFAGLAGDQKYIATEALAAAETKVYQEEITLRAELEGGILAMIDGNSRITDRYFGTGKIRGFEPQGIGPRDGGEALGGNVYAVARFEAEFPLGLPEEYGITGGVFADFGSVWSLDNTNGGLVDDGFHLRSSIGVSVFWDTVIGPLRFNFSEALVKETYDKEQSFDLTISTRF
ncbi:outer membrane protein assembly factor BamA [Actibacterium sp. XHP0104]|nr:outer membrane protein assembly factor BamA [Actibacterium sp. XHP0104]MCV2881133.1 outer membrane protein assembly factor BamA [Actibacterium sp. XHP0104]